MAGIFRFAATLALADVFPADGFLETAINIFNFHNGSLICYHAGQPEAIVLCSELKVNTCPGFEVSKTVFKVTGKSAKTKVIKCEKIEKMKCITIGDNDGNPIYLSKLLNTSELE